MVGLGRVRDCVLVDINTQYDFCDPRGRNPIRNCEPLTAALRQVFDWAALGQVPVVSSIDSHRPCEINSHLSPEYCLDGTSGQRKLPFTELTPSITIDGDNTLSPPGDLFALHRQVIFHKRTLDLLANPKADRLLSQIKINNFVLCGVSVEHSIRCLALGLLSRGKNVYVLRDACGFWTECDADLTLRLLQAKGARIISSADLATWNARLNAPSANGSINGSANGSTTNGHGLNGKSHCNGNGRLNGKPKAAEGATDATA